MSKKFYITTPLYYPSGQLHLGHAYTTVLADSISRYKKMQGYDVFFLTGSDEHGQKIQEKAKELNLEPKEYLEDKVLAFKELWSKLKIDYSKFVRTTDDAHIKTVQKIFSLLLNKGLIYKGFYKGFYCISCEEFLTKIQINENNTCVVCGNIPKEIDEDTYFLKTSLFNEFEKDLMNTEFLVPSFRRNEMLKNFIETGIKDLSVTRTTFNWGIPIIEDNNHVIYVWLDALSSYITGLNFLKNDDSLFQEFWNNEEVEILQLAGKEIIRFHSIYWPIILKSLDLRLPNKLLGHGWILNKNTKMSKSIGNVVNPLDILEKYGLDALRFYICFNLPTDRDGNFTNELLEESFNTNLANNIGNLISRTHNMIEKYFNGLLNIENKINIIDNEVEENRIKTILKYESFMNQYKISESIDILLQLGQYYNKYIEQNAPWTLEKEGKIEKLEKVIYSLQLGISTITFLLKPFLVEWYEEMRIQCGFDDFILNFKNIIDYKSFKFKKLSVKNNIYIRIK